MRFVVDVNLPKRLSDWLIEQGHQSEHLLENGSAQAPDDEIWRHAHHLDAIIVSKDEDFATWVKAGRDGPRVLWLRTGNGSTASVLALMDTVMARVEARFAEGDRLVEVR